MSKEVIHLLVTSEDEPNIGIIKTTMPLNISPLPTLDVKVEEIIEKLKLALSDHFDCDVKDVKVEQLDIKSFTALKIEALCSIPDGGSEYEDVFVVTLTKSYVY